MRLRSSVAEAEGLGIDGWETAGSRTSRESGDSHAGVISACVGGALARRARLFSLLNTED